MSCYTYIIYSQTAKSYYAGITNNIEKRLKEHNKCKTRTTAKFRDWEIVYTKFFSNRNEAYEHEKHIKGIGPKRFYQSLGNGTVG